MSGSLPGLWDGIAGRRRCVLAGPWRASAAMTWCGGPGSLAGLRRGCSPATLAGQDGTRAGWCAGRCARGPPCTIWMTRPASRTSTCGPSAPSAAMDRSRTGGGERLITVPRSSAAVPVTRYRSPAAGWICPAAPSRCRRTPTRPRSCANTCLPRGPPRRGSWLPGRPCSSVPGRSPGRSSGRPALRAGMLNARDSLDGVRDHSVRRRTRLHGTRSSGQRSQSDSRTWPTSRCKPHKYPPFGTAAGSRLLCHEVAPGWVLWARHVQFCCD